MDMVQTDGAREEPPSPEPTLPSPERSSPPPINQVSSPVLDDAESAPISEDETVKEVDVSPPPKEPESSLSPREGSPRKSPHLIGIPSPKTWDQWIKKTSPTEENKAITTPDEVVCVIEQEEGTNEIIIDDKGWVTADTAATPLRPPCKSASGECSMKTIVEEPDEDETSAEPFPKSAIKKENSEPRVVIKSTRFQVIPAVDVWEPDPDRIKQQDQDQEDILDDPRYETHLNQLTMVESQLKKLKKDVVIKTQDPQKKHPERKPGILPGILSIFKKKDSGSNNSDKKAGASSKPSQKMRVPGSTAVAVPGGRQILPKRHSPAKDPPRQLKLPPQVL